MRRTNSVSAPTATIPQECAAAPAAGWGSAEQLFAGPRPASMRRGREPAFLLLDRALIEQLQRAANDQGIRRDALVHRIAREQLDKY